MCRPSISPHLNLTVSGLTDRFNKQVNTALLQLQQTDENKPTGFQVVDRKQPPPVVIGLLLHGAVHTKRHLGQLHVTVKVLQQQ